MADRSAPINDSSSPAAGSPSVTAEDPQHYVPLSSLVGPPRDPRGGLYPPNFGGGVLPDNSIPGIVHHLMHPDRLLYSEDKQTVTLSITWAVGIAGKERFRSPNRGRGHFLLSRDPLCKAGVATGLSQEILSWLKDGDATLVLPASHFSQQV